MSSREIETLTTWFDEARNAVFFGGAGVSTASGIPDFRSAAGLYASRADIGRSPEYLLSHDCLMREPQEFYTFHRAELVRPDAKPNRAHTALARLEADGRLAAVVTQNIDGLHQAAGSKIVHEVHGSLARNYCLGRDRHEFRLDEIPDEPVVPICPQCGAMIRPDVVLYGEALDSDVVAASIRAIADADLVVVGGTSLVVYPAAGFVDYFRGDRLAVVNLGSTGADGRANLRISEPVDEVLSLICQQLFGDSVVG